jgi:hypothetical protein
MTDDADRLALLLGDATEDERTIVAGVVRNVGVSRIMRAQQLSKLAQGLRARALGGEAIDLGELARIEAMAIEAETALGLAKPSTKIDADDGVFGEIIGERGGIHALSASHIAIARALATELSSGDINAKVVADLMALLPPPKPGPRPDWSKLSDEQLNEAHRLMAIACGTEPPAPLPPEAPQTMREREAMQLAKRLDAVEARGDTMSEDDLIATRNCVLTMVLPMTLPARLWAPYSPTPPSAPAFVPEPDPETTRPRPSLSHGEAIGNGSGNSNVVPLGIGPGNPAFDRDKRGWPEY